MTAVSISPLEEGVPTAGDNYTLQCNVSRQATLDPSTVLEVMWFNSTNDTVISGNGVTLTGSSRTMDTTLTSTLTFTHLRTSQGGVYRCAVSMTIPGIMDNHVVSRSAQVSVTSK